MVGIALRRGGELVLAEQVLNISLSLAAAREERSAVLEELSLVHQQKGEKEGRANPENILPWHRKRLAGSFRRTL